MFSVCATLPCSIICSNLTFSDVCTRGKMEHYVCSIEIYGTVAPKPLPPFNPSLAPNLKAINMYLMLKHTCLGNNSYTYIDICHIMVTGFNYRSSRIVCGSNRQQIDSQGINHKNFEDKMLSKWKMMHGREKCSPNIIITTNWKLL